jgi:aminoglycoside phosphotransferase (APT) family kinase protein
VTGNGTGSDVSPVRAGDDLDWPVIERYLRYRVDGLEESMEVAQFPHGTANLTYLLTFGHARLVLRRPPFGDLAPGAHDMKREFKVLSRLWRVYDKAPRAFVLCEDLSVAGADFFVMEYRPGVVIRAAVPPAMSTIPDVGNQVGHAFVDAIAELHGVDPEASDLGDLGRPDNFVARQVAGWTKRWDLARPPAGVPMMDTLARELAAALPTPQRTSVLHNDPHLGNCQFDPREPTRVKSLFDWDMATLGDPLVDLGGLLAYWRDDRDFPPAGSSSPDPSLVLPTRAEVIGQYASATGLDVTGVGWYHAFGRWKIAIIMQQLHNRYLQGKSNDERLATFGDNVSRLAESAFCVLRGEPWRDVVQELR